MNQTNPYYTYGRIAPSPLFRDSRRSFTANEAFDWYFQSDIVGNASHLKANKEAYFASLDTTIDANDNLKNMPRETKLMIAIPVSSNEYETIYDTLKLYTMQGRSALRRTQFVLIVSQEKSDDISVEKSRATYEEIARAQRNFPELHITLLSISWPKTFAKKRAGGLYSAALKIVTDTCLRAVQRKDIDPLIITNDANPRSISKNYLLHYMRALHNNPAANVFLGKIHWDIARMRAVPGYGLAVTVFMAAQDRLRESSESMPLDSWSANSGYRASALAAIGGVDGDIGVKGSAQGFGADIDLGRRFFAARRSNDYFCMVHEAWVDSYGDRLLRQYLCNKSLTHAWHECDNNASSNDLKLFVEMTENVAADFDHIKQRIEHLLSLMFSDQGWVCFEDEAIITATLNTVLLGTPEPDTPQPLWVMEGKRNARSILFTDDGTQRLKDILPHLADIIQESLTELDDMMYAKLRSDKSFFATPPKRIPSVVQKRRIGSRALES